MFSIAYSLIGLIKDWDKISGEDKALVILSMVGEVTEGLSFAVEAWKTWKGRTGMVVLDQLDTMETDQGTYRSLQENADSLISTAEEVSGDEGIGVSIGEKITGEGGVPTESTEGEGGWNKPLEELPDNVPPGGEEAASEFGMEGKLMNVLSIALGLAIAVLMTFSLVYDWDSMSTIDKVFNVLSLVVQVLSVALEITDLGIEAGFWAVSATMAAALPVIGAVLAILGIILAIVSLLVSLFGGGDSDPIEDYIDGTGGQVIDSFDDAPDPRLDYTVSPDRLSSGSVSSVTITGTNRGTEDVSLAGVTISILRGDDESCLFSDTDKIVLVEDPTTEKDRVYVSPNDNAAGDLPFRTAFDVDERYYYRYDLGVGGKKKENESLLQQLVVKPKALFSATWSATANINGRGKTAKVDVVEKTRSDMAHALLRVSLV